MRYLLDTNVCVDYFRGRDAVLVAKVQGTSNSELCLSSVVVAELRYGAERSQKPEKNHAQVDMLLQQIECLSFDESASTEFGQLRRYLESLGVAIGPYDLLIAAQAKSLGLTLVTGNLKEFERVPELLVESWRSE